jgi:hypothetical protein
VVALIKANKADDKAAVIPADTLINDYINENYGSVLWIKSTDDLRGAHNKNNLDNLVVPDLQPRVKLVARYETDIKRLHLILKPFRQWCAKQRLNFDSVVTEIENRYGGQKTRIRLGKGTKMDLPPVTVLSLDFSDLKRPEDAETDGRAA